MYFGHFAFGLAAKPAAPKVSLGILLVATQLIDILYAVFLLVGIGEPDGSVWDHGLVMSFVWSALTVAVFFLVSRDIRSSILVGLLVLSHWVCDFIAYPALPIAFSDSLRAGLGLYSSVGAMLAGDFILFGGALAFYLRRTKPNDRKGKWAPWLLVAYLVILISTVMLPGKLIIIMALGMVLVMPIGMWIDRHRVVIPGNRRKAGIVKA